MRERLAQVGLRDFLVPIAKPVGREEPAPLLQPRQEACLPGVVLGVVQRGELLAQQLAVAHELRPRCAKAGKVDVVDELLVVRARRGRAACRQDQPRDALAEVGPRPLGKAEEQRRAQPFVLGTRGHVDRVVEPQCHLDRVAVVEQRRHFVEAMQAIVDVLQVVEPAIVAAEAPEQVRVDGVRVRRRRRRHRAAPDRAEASRVGDHRAPRASASRERRRVSANAAARRAAGRHPRARGVAGPMANSRAGRVTHGVSTSAYGNDAPRGTLRAPDGRACRSAA